MRLPLCVCAVQLAAAGVLAVRIQAFTVRSQTRREGVSRAISSTTGQDVHRPSACLERIDVAGLSPSQVSEKVDFSRPCVLTGALSTPDCEAWCDALLEDLGEETCAFQIRDNKSGHTDVFEARLEDFVQGLQDESTHDESW